MAYTDSETYIDERTVPMNSEPRVLSIVNDAGIAEKDLKREDEEGMGGKPGVGQFPTISATS